MDNLKTLFDKKQYDLIIKLTDHTYDANSLFFRISAFMIKNQLDDALEVIELNHVELEKHLSPLMKTHIELLCLKGDFEAANRAIDHYNSLPYQSQLAEEELKSLPSIILKYKQEDKISHKYMDEEEIISKLISKEEGSVLLGLSALEDKEIRNYLIYLQKIMLSFPLQHIRAYTLLLLVSKEYSKEIKYNLQGKINTYVPINLKAPFISDDFKKIIYKMETTFKDPTISNNAIMYLSMYILNIYPNEIDLNDNNLLVALYELASEALQNKSKYEAIKDFDRLEVDKLKNDIKNLINN